MSLSGSCRPDLYFSTENKFNLLPFGGKAVLSRQHNIAKYTYYAANIHNLYPDNAIMLLTKGVDIKA